MGGYSFFGDHAGFGSNRAAHRDADMMFASSESRRVRHTLLVIPIAQISIQSAACQGL
jgi:hypothetical protein